MKICTKCKKGKPDSDFRVRTETRLYKCKGGNPFQYLNNTCRECDRILTKESCDKKKDTEEYILKNRERINKYRVENREKVLAREKERKKTKEWKEYRQAYDRENKNRIAALNIERNRKHVRKNIAEINDAYVITQLSHPRNKIKKTRQEIKKDKDLILLTKVVIANNRIRKILKKLANEK